MILRKPRKGDEIFYKGEFAGNVLKLDDNICVLDTLTKDGSNEHCRFIWRFVDNGKETFNNLHTIHEVQNENL